jgi:hypothetical protein
MKTIKAVLFNVEKRNNIISASGNSADNRERSQLRVLLHSLEKYLDVIRIDVGVDAVAQVGYPASGAEGFGHLGALLLQNVLLGVKAG